MPGAQSPAGDDRHGIYATELKADYFWFQNPSFLREHPSKWPISNDQLPEGTDLEEVYPIHIGAVTAAESRIDQLIETSTSLTALKRNVLEMDGDSEKNHRGPVAEGFREVCVTCAGGTVSN